MRCPDCNKFVGNDEQEPEVESVEVEADESGHATVTASVRIVNACADCGTELTEATLDLEAEVTLEPADHKCPSETAGEEPALDLEAEETSSERTNRSDGKPNTPSRYRRTFYGAQVEATVKCRCGKIETTVTLADEVQASGMESMV
jgi:hypothetical protein